MARTLNKAELVGSDATQDERRSLALKAAKARLRRFDSQGSMFPLRRKILASQPSLAYPISRQV